MTYDDCVKIAFELEGVEESLYYGSPAIKRNGRVMFGCKEDGEALSIKVDWDTHDRLLAERPDAYYKTPHYETWPWFLVRFKLLTEDELRDLIKTSWADAPKPGKRRKG